MAVMVCDWAATREPGRPSHHQASRSQLGEDAADDAVHAVGSPYTMPPGWLFRVVPDGGMRVDQVDGPQLRGVREQRGGRRFHAWRDNAADEAPVRVDDFHIGGRAEIHHDHGGAVQRLRGHGVGHAVGPIS